jgi:F0F1-type ATP synthase membrane subunit a
MLQRFGIRSRAGNFALAAVGAMYTVAAVVLLVYYGASVWRAASTGDLALQLLLACGLFAGVYFVSVARVNLGHHLRHP